MQRNFFLASIALQCNVLRMSKKINITVRLSEEQKNKLEAIAKADYRTMGAVIQIAVAQLLQAKEKKPSGVAA